MKDQGCQPISCCSKIAWHGGVASSDFATLDELAVKLICLDSGFAMPLREVGQVLGTRIAMERGERPLTFDAALSALIVACGLQGVIDSRFLHCDADGALLQIVGCAEVLGRPVASVGRTVCGFDAGLFEGFLRAATGEKDLTVEETACLGMGHPSCEFVVQKGVHHGGY